MRLVVFGAVVVAMLGCAEPHRPPPAEERKPHPQPSALPAVHQELSPAPPAATSASPSPKMRERHMASYYHPHASPRRDSHVNVPRRPLETLTRTSLRCS